MTVTGIRAKCSAASSIVLALLCLSVTCCGGGAKKSDDAGTATLTWIAPEKNADGSTLHGLAGFRIYYGTTSGSHGRSIAIPADRARCENNGKATQCTAAVKGLSSGFYYFCMTAYDEGGHESDYSNEVSKRIE